MTKKKHETGSERRLSSRLSGKKTPFYGCITKNFTTIDKISSEDNASRSTDCDVLSVSARRASFRLSAQKRPFYGTSLRKKIQVECGTKLTVETVGGGSGRRASFRLSTQKRPFYGCSVKKKKEKVCTEEIAEEELKEEEGDTKSASSEIVENCDMLRGSHRRFSSRLAGIDRPFYGCSNRKVSSNTKDEKFCESKRDFKILRENECAKSSVVVGGDQLTSSGRRASSRLLGIKRPFYGCSRRKISFDSENGGFSTEKITENAKTKVELNDLKEDDGPKTPTTEMVERGDLLTGSEKRARRLSGKRQPFYGSTMKEISSGTVNEGISSVVTEIGKTKRELRDLKEDGDTKSPSSEMVERGEILTGLERRASSRLSGQKRPSEKEGISSAIIETHKTKRELKDLKEDSGTRSPSSEIVEPDDLLTGSERRASSRLSGKKRPFYGSSMKKISCVAENERIRSKNLTEEFLKEDGDGTKSPSSEVVEASDQFNQGGEVLVAGDRWINYNRSSNDLGGKGAYQRVKKTINLFNKLHLQLSQEEVKTCETEAKNNGVKNTRKGSNKLSTGEDAKHITKRPDLKAVSKMMETGSILYRTKRFGSIPGVDVGHQFCSRAEMVVVGLHGHWLKGIDFMSVKDYSKLEQYKSYIFPLAVSVVMSGMYEDDLDNSEDVVYTGQGGNDLLGNKRQVSDQVMANGNLALKNNMEQKVPVRLIRSHKSASSYTGKVYTYDGLYMVISHWAEKGVAGFTVFKYQLRRIEGQPALTSSPVSYLRGRVPKSPSELQGRVCDDISGHQENIPIPASNLVDNPAVAPMGYKYCKSIQLAEGLKLPTIATGCSCKGACTDPRKCACAKLNGSDFPYVSKDGGRLIEAKSVVFECGPKCKCGPNCVNRTSQRGLRYRLEVFRTKNKGWGVRSWDFIPSGAPICEYTGRLMRTSDLDNVSGNDFIFEIDCLQTIKGLDGRESRAGVVSLPTTSDLQKKDDKKIETESEFCIDAGTMGGVARFINHSCEPNLFVQCVLSTHHDIKLARIVLFASEDIPPLQELTYDYGYVLDSVMGPDGKIKVMPCYCGAKNCRKRLY